MLFFLAHASSVALFCCLNWKLGIWLFCKRGQCLFAKYVSSKLYVTQHINFLIQYKTSNSNFDRDEMTHTLFLFYKTLTSFLSHTSPSICENIWDVWCICYLNRHAVCVNFTASNRNECLSEKSKGICVIYANAIYPFYYNNLKQNKWKQHIIPHFFFKIDWYLINYLLNISYPCMLQSTPGFWMGWRMGKCKVGWLV